MKQVLIDLEKFKLGFYALEDTTKAPFGSLRVMKNSRITDRGGISPRPGVTLLGSENSSQKKIRGFFSYKRSFASNEILIKNYDDEMEAYSNNHSSAGWFRVKDGFTADKEFGYVTSLVNASNADYLVGCNRFDDYFRWTGAITQLNGALAGGETAVVVDSVLEEDVFYTGTANGATSATTVQVTAAPWAADQWNSFEIYITSGTHIGKVRKITDTTTDTLTFDTLGSDPGACTFEIRKLAFPESGTIIYAGTQIAYTTIVEYNKFPVSSAHAGADNTPVTSATTVYAGNPRGNRFTNYLGRIIVGNVRSAMARGSGGALQGYSTGGSVFVSKLLDPFDFGFTATRVAGEGDIISAPYGGGEWTDVQAQEENAYLFKQSYIEALQYSQDANDLAVRTPLKSGIGSIGKTVKGADDIYFITPDKQVTSIGRVKTKDIKPQTQNIGYNIKRFLENCGMDDVGRGAEFKEKLHFPVKSSTTVTDNDIILIYNKLGNGFWEGIWDLPAFALDIFNGELCYAESNGANVYKMYQDQHADVIGETRYPIFSEVATHFFNLTPAKSNTQAMNALYVEGYIRGGTTVTFRAWKQFSSSAFLEFTFSTDETGLLDGEQSQAFLGGSPLSIGTLGATFSDPDADGRRHFSFTVYFPPQYANFFSVGHSSNGTDFDYEITRYGLGLKEDVSVDATRVKTI